MLAHKARKARAAPKAIPDSRGFRGRQARPALTGRPVLPDHLARRGRMGIKVRPARQARKANPVPLENPARMGRWALRAWLARLGKRVPKVRRARKG